MTDSKLLELEIERSGIKRNRIAAYLGISYRALYDKIHNKTDFKVTEMCTLCKMLNISNAECERIFFTPDVDKKSTKEQEAS